MATNKNRTRELRWAGARDRLRNLLGQAVPPESPIETVLAPEVFWRAISAARQPVLLLRAHPLELLQASDEALALLGLSSLAQAREVLIQALEAPQKTRLVQALQWQVVLEQHYVKLHIQGHTHFLRVTVTSLPEHSEQDLGLVYLFPAQEPEHAGLAWPKAIWAVTAQLPYAVWILDAQGKVLYCNEAFQGFPLNQSLDLREPLDRAALERAQVQLRALPDQARLSKTLVDLTVSFGSQGRWRILHFAINPQALDSRVCALAFKLEPSPAMIPASQPLSQSLSELLPPSTLVKVLQVREDERTSIGREIHDYLGSELTVLRMELHRLRNIVNATSASDQVAVYLDSVCAQTEKLALSARRIAYDLRQEFVKSYGLTQSVHDLVLDMRYRVGLDIQLEFNPEWLEPEDHLARHLHRSVQELLNNVSKHAKATRCLVRLGLSDRSYWLEVQDNGVGMTAPAKKHSVGFASLRERAALYGGTVTIESRPAIEGTRVRVTMSAS